MLCHTGTGSGSLKHIEDTVEQNDNNFDGIINNSPRRPPLENCEPISLVDYADAIKAAKGRGSDKEKKTSIRAQLRAENERAAQKKTAKSKNHELEV